MTSRTWKWHPETGWTITDHDVGTGGNEQARPRHQFVIPWGTVPKVAVCLLCSRKRDDKIHETRFRAVERALVNDI